ncbi:HAMP domain-containing histidine kinase [Streptomyces sp. BHT-5-2]|uniref:sensor histidine kinase n=1 Tax=Streptomyces sp. BHT-5-2 TaxID=2866715 RepID=UPI001C8E68E3|nr:HAMP domain-containing sensor histidine kinase [Streptomyces sp. BHT-5-2]QZL04311.1 HAMP domain-containing histidine kinase [Streptomyces sp. BHT-5-2]
MTGTPADRPGVRVRRAAGQPRARAALTAALLAVLALAAGIAWLQYADAAAGPPGTTLVERLKTERVGPQLDQAVLLGVPLTGVLVAGGTWAAGRGGAPVPRLRAALTAGAAATLLLLADGLWLQDLDAIRPDYTAQAALYWGMRLGAPTIGLITGATAWGFARPSGRGLPLRAGSAFLAGATAALLVLLALLWLRHVNTSYPVFSVDAALTWGTLVGVPAVGLLVAATAWAAAGRALRPVDEIRRELDDITAHSLDRRVPVPASGDEITKLARSTNATLDRLHSAAERQQRFVADASHELRSPLATLRASLEAALTHPHGIDWSDVVRGALTDITRLQNLSEDLLLLTRLDASTPPQGDTVELSALAHDLVAEYQHLRHTHPLDIRCTADGPAHVRGSALQLERLLRNLLDNACRYARTTVQVTLRTEHTDHTPCTDTDDRPTLRLHVVDDGPGIPPADQERVFERFTRLDDARSRHTGGAGLGLAIAREIAVRHGGTLHVADSPQGAHLVTELPRHHPEQ